MAEKMRYFRIYVNVILILISNWIVVRKQSLGPPYTAFDFIDMYLLKP